MSQCDKVDQRLQEADDAALEDELNDFVMMTAATSTTVTHHHYHEMMTHHHYNEGMARAVLS